MESTRQVRQIAYLAQTFPGLTTVYREVMALRDQGLDVKTFATWQTPLEKVSGKAESLISNTFYIFPIHWPTFLKAHLAYLLTKPLAYLATLAFVLTRPAQSLAKRRRTLLHFFEAVYLAQAIEKQHIDHIHVHFALNATTLALVVKRLTGIPYSFTAHANDIFADQVILKEKIQAASFIIAISEYNKRFLVDYTGDSTVANKIHVIHSGIPLNDFTPDNTTPANISPPLILSVGRLVEKKGFPFLVRACHQLQERGYQFQCVILGDGEQKALLQQFVADLNLQQHVQLLGWVDQPQIQAYLKKATIFALPCIVAANQDRDGIPAVLMEAMAMAKPCVSTTVSGIPELITHEKSGLLVPEKNETALADALIRLIDDPQLAQQLGQAGQQAVEQVFNLEVIATQLHHLFTQQLTQKPDPNPRVFTPSPTMKSTR